ncbi:MAG: hypothetical protein U9N87_01400, partial [Planctomycetota bacterium]|nr:hypothetical protein [Planctomycetota bacterium]
MKVSKMLIAMAVLLSLGLASLAQADTGILVDFEFDATHQAPAPDSLGRYWNSAVYSSSYQAVVSSLMDDAGNTITGAELYLYDQPYGRWHDGVTSSSITNYPGDVTWDNWYLFANDYDAENPPHAGHNCFTEFSFRGLTAGDRYDVTVYGSRGDTTAANSAQLRVRVNNNDADIKLCYTGLEGKVVFEDIAVRADGTLNLDIWATGAGSDPRFDYAYINAFELQPVPEP